MVVTLKSDISRFCIKSDTGQFSKPRACLMLPGLRNRGYSYTTLMTDCRAAYLLLFRTRIELCNDSRLEIRDCSSYQLLSRIASFNGCDTITSRINTVRSPVTLPLPPYPSVYSEWVYIFLHDPETNALSTGIQTSYTCVTSVSNSHIFTYMVCLEEHKFKRGNYLLSC